MTKPERSNPRTEASTSEPLGGWFSHTPNGLLKQCGAGADDRLEVLSVLVAWMMRELKLPIKLAVDSVCDALTAGTETYLLTTEGYAEPLPETYSFEYVPWVNLNEPERKPSDENVGVPGLIKHLRLRWSHSRTFFSESPADTCYGAHLLNPLAVRLSDADRLWGYGCRRPESDVPAATAPGIEPKAQAEPVLTQVAALEKDKPAGLLDDPMQRRASLLALFREEGGKRKKVEKGNAGKRGALARVVEQSGIDKDTLGAMLDKAIEEKRHADAYAQLTANR